MREDKEEVDIITMTEMILDTEEMIDQEIMINIEITITTKDTNEEMIADPMIETLNTTTEIEIEKATTTRKEIMIERKKVDIETTINDQEIIIEKEQRKMELVLFASEEQEGRNTSSTNGIVRAIESFDSSLISNSERAIHNIVVC
jgi:hypothetical protein